MILSYRAVDGSDGFSMIFIVDSLFFRDFQPRLSRRHMKYLSVKTKPRSFSGRDIRHGSSGDGAETFEIETCALIGSYFGLGSSGCWHVFKIVSTFISARRSTY